MKDSDNSDIFPIVAGIVADELFLARSQVTPDARLIDELGATSLLVVEMVLALENRFRIRIPGERSMAAETVADLVGLVREQTAREQTAVRI